MSFEDKLKQQTPDKQVVAETQNQLHIAQLTKLARDEICIFKSLCEECAAQGQKTCSTFSSTWVDHGTTANDFHGDENLYVGAEHGGVINIRCKIEPKDSELFLALLNQALGENEFKNATIKKHPIYLNRVTYTRHRRIFNVKVKTHEKQELAAEKYYFTTSW